MLPGMARFFAAQQVSSVSNPAEMPAEVVVIELKGSSEAAQGCRCTGVVARTVCGCRGALNLPPFWAVALGGVTIAGTSLSPGQSCSPTLPRRDTLLVAITSMELGYSVAGNTNSEPTGAQTRVTLRPGEVTWLPHGRRQLVNLGDVPARFVNIELD